MNYLLTRCMFSKEGEECAFTFRLHRCPFHFSCCCISLLNKHDWYLYVPERPQTRLSKLLVVFVKAPFAVLLDVKDPLARSIRTLERS
jgi:hypothetical protein